MSIPEPRVSMPEQGLSKPEHHEHQNVTSSVPRLQFPYRILPGDPFLLLYRFLLEKSGSLLPKSKLLVIIFHLEHANGPNGQRALLKLR